MVSLANCGGGGGNGLVGFSGMSSSTHSSRIAVVSSSSPCSIILRLVVGVSMMGVEAFAFSGCGDDVAEDSLAAAAAARGGGNGAGRF